MDIMQATSSLRVTFKAINFSESMASFIKWIDNAHFTRSVRQKTSYKYSLLIAPQNLTQNHQHLSIHPALLHFLENLSLQQESTETVFFCHLILVPVTGHLFLPCDFMLFSWSNFRKWLSVSILSSQFSSSSMTTQPRSSCYIATYL